MKLTPYLRYGLTVTAMMAAATMLSGCLGDPTYGTGQTQSQHLAEDVGNLISLPRDTGRNIKYEPRPDIVEPPKGDASVLPPPQQDVASKNNPNWPESPEEVRKKMVAKIDEENGNLKELPLGASPRMWDGGRPAFMTSQQTKEFRQAIAVQKGNYTGRKFLSDPPSNLRQPAPGVPTDKLGTPEEVKQRERLAAAKKKGTGGWWPF